MTDVYATDDRIGYHQCVTGSVYKSHSQNNQGLQVIVYYDDVEVCNPLGSKAKKHNLGG